MKRVLASVVLLFVYLSACNRLEFPMEPVPEEAVEAVFNHLEWNIKSFYSTFGGEVIIDPSNFEIIGAKQLDPNSPSIEEKWCLAIVYETYDTDANLTIDQRALYLVSLLKTGWQPYRTNWESGTPNFVRDFNFGWEKFCRDST